MNSSDREVGPPVDHEPLLANAKGSDKMETELGDSSDRNESSSLLRFFSRPAVGIIGSVASVIGIALSVYFFMASRQKPELTYFVHPAKAAVVRTGQSSRLAVQFDGRDVTSDVLAAQIAFWNAGSKSIRVTDVLSPLVIRTGNGGRILEAKLRKTSRDVVQITLNPSRLAIGEVEIGWNILEQNDGGVLQIVYVGDETVDIQAHAVLEGQPELKLQYGEKLRDLGEEYTRRRGLVFGLGFHLLTIAMGILTFVMFFPKRGMLQKFGPLKWVVLLMGPAMICLGIWGLMTRPPAGPPFGF